MTLPPPLEKLLNTPVLQSEVPAGFAHPSVSNLGPVPRYHVIGAVRIEFKNHTTTEAVSFALFKTQAQANSFAQVARNVKTGGLFRTQVAVVGKFVLSAAAATRAQAKDLMSFATAHLRRVER